MIKCRDLTGQRFGRLVVVSRAEDYVSPKGSKRAKWFCRCDCGKEKVVVSDSLISGQTQSCGCYRNERIIEGKIERGLLNTNQGRNIVRSEGNLVYIKMMNSDNEMICDLEDWELLKGWTWKESSKGYARHIIHNPGNGNKTQVISAHRLITEAKEGDIVDHINRNRLDNRKSNLRLATMRINALNRELRNGNSVGYAGVTKQKKKWVARIMKDGKYGTVGHYDSRELAIKARKQAELEEYGVLSKDNCI